MAAGWLLTAAPAAKPTVIFIAPAPLRAQVRAALVKLGKTPIDASPIDVAMYGDDAHPSPLQHGELDAPPPPELPADVAADWTLGLAHCRAWPNASATAKKSCGRAVAEAAWQRHIEKLKPQRLIELKLHGHYVQAVSYAVHDRLIPIVSGSIDDAHTLPARLIPGLLDPVKLPINGNRPNSDRLPGVVPPTAVDLDALPAPPVRPIAMPASCKGPLPLLRVVGPKGMAKAAERFWAASAGERMDPKRGSMTCELAFLPDSPARRAGGEPFLNASLNCDAASLNEMQLFPSDDLTDPSLQAAVISTLVGGLLAERCLPPPAH